MPSAQQRDLWQVVSLVFPGRRCVGLSLKVAGSGDGECLGSALTWCPRLQGEPPPRELGCRVAYLACVFHIFPACSFIILILKNRFWGVCLKWWGLFHIALPDTKTLTSPLHPVATNSQASRQGQCGSRLGQTTNSCMVNCGFLPLPPFPLKISALEIKDKKFFGVIRDCWALMVIMKGNIPTDLQQEKAVREAMQVEKK